MALWTCASCKELNAGRATTCTGCGADRQGGRIQAQAADWRCSWLEGGRQCQMPATVGAKDPKCSWHAWVRDHPRLAQEYDEFERWVGFLLEARYCAPWTHYPVRILWRWVHGEPDQEFAKPCAAWSCPHRADAEPEERSARDAARAVRELVAKISNPPERRGGLLSTLERAAIAAGHALQAERKGVK